jgi:hypothetical protein
MSSGADLVVAHVGHTGTDADRDRWLAARLWFRRAVPALERRYRDTDGGVLRQDYIDLNGEPRRDFLAEDARYDVVITHDLWGFTRVTGAAAGAEASGPTACSSLHAAEGWRRRLVATGASYIFMFGPHLNASTLGRALPGYRCLDIGLASYLDVFASQSATVGSESRAPIRYRDMAAERLSHLDELSQNEALDLSFSALGSEGVRHLARMNRLSDLRLTGTPVADADLAQVVASGGLRKLDLDETAVGDEGLRHVGRLPRLECLSLNHTRVEDAGLAHLEGTRQLEWLSLVGTKVTDAGLERLRPLGNLRYLSIVDTGVTSRGVEELRRALPQCTIDFDGGESDQP